MKKPTQLPAQQAQQSSAGYQSTQAPNHSLHVPNWGTWRQKDVTKAIYYLIRSYISESALQSVTASLTILPLLSEASLIQATSTLSIWRVTTVNKHLLLLPDCSTLKSRNIRKSAWVQRSNWQLKAPFHYVQAQFISGELKTTISSLNSYSN